MVRWHLKLSINPTFQLVTVKIIVPLSVSMFHQSSNKIWDNVRILWWMSHILKHSSCSNEHYYWLPRKSKSLILQHKIFFWFNKKTWKKMLTIFMYSIKGWHIWSPGKLWHDIRWRQDFQMNIKLKVTLFAFLFAFPFPFSSMHLLFLMHAKPVYL